MQWDAGALPIGGIAAPSGRGVRCALKDAAHRLENRLRAEALGGRGRLAACLMLPPEQLVQ